MLESFQTIIKAKEESWTRNQSRIILKTKTITKRDKRDRQAYGVKLCPALHDLETASSVCALAFKIMPTNTMTHNMLSMFYHVKLLKKPRVVKIFSWNESPYYILHFMSTYWRWVSIAESHNIMMILEGFPFFVPLNFMQKQNIIDHYCYTFQKLE